MRGSEIRVLLFETDKTIASKIEKSLHGFDEGTRFKIQVLESIEKYEGDLSKGAVDIVLMDLDSKKRFWLQTIRQMTVKSPDTPIVVYTAVSNPNIVKQAMNVGATDYLMEGAIEDSCCLARVLKYVVNQARLEKQLIQAQKMESVGHLAGGIAHDFNNLLSVINGYSELVMSAMDHDSENYESMREIKMAGERASSLTRQLLTFSRQQITQPKIINLNELIVNLDKMLKRLIGEDVELVILPASEDALVMIDGTQMETVLMNLVINARDAMPSGGKLIINIKQTCFDHDYVSSHDSIQLGDYVMISVTDTGIGMTDEVKAHLFKPFFSTKEKGKGTGLGLATCYEIVKLGQGSLDVYSEVGHGTTFKIYLPRVVNFQGKQEETKKVEILPSGHETIMLVEDELSVRGLARHILTQHGYRVIEATNGEEAFVMLQRKTDQKIDLLITDMIMPLMGGAQLAERLAEIKPDIKVLFVSGYPEKLIDQNEVHKGNIHFLQKPFSRQSLLQSVHQIIKKPEIDKAA